MAYIGQQPVVGRYILLDQISGGFDGSASGFTMSTAGGAQGVNPGLAQNVLLSLGGVIQQPGVDYTISGSGLTFTTPPVSGTTFFATVLGDAQSVGTPSDGTVTPASIASGFDFGFPNVNVTGVTTIASGSAAAPSLTITGDTDTGLFSPAANVLAITTSGSAALTVSGTNVGVGTSSPPAILSTRPSGSTTTSSTDFSGDGLFIDCVNTTDANDAYGTAISWSRSSLTTPFRLAAISNVQTASDPDIQGLAFLVHNSINNNNPLIEGMRITGAGNVGIGTTSPSQQKLTIDVDNANTTAASFNGINVCNTDNTTNNGSVITFGQELTGNSSARIGAINTDHTNGSESQDIFFATIGAGTYSERMRIDSSGRLLVGTNSARTEWFNTTVNAALIESETTNLNVFSGAQNSANTFGPWILLGKSRGGASGDFDLVADDDQIGSISFQGADGSHMVEGANIRAFVDGTTDSNEMPGRIVFSTNAGTTNATPTERLRITSDGNIIHTYSDSSTTTSTQVPPGLRINNTDNTLGRLAGIHFAHGGGGTANAGIFHVTTNTATPSTTCLGDLAFYMKAGGSSTMTERMRLDSDGRLLIGRTSNIGATSTLETYRTTDNSVFIASTDATTGNTALLDFGPANEVVGSRIVCEAENDFSVTGNRTARLEFHTRLSGVLSEAMRIKSNGSLQVGGNSDLGSQLIQIEGATNATADLIIANNVASSGQTSTITFAPANNITGGRIICEAEEDFSSGANRTARLEFYTRLDGTLAERMRITSGGTLLLNGASSNPTGATTSLYTDSANNTSEGITIKSPATSGNRFMIGFYDNNNSKVGDIVHDGSVTNYNETSDYRLKENIAPLTGAINRLKQLQPSQFNFIANPGRRVDGFIAHEVQAVVPECVTGIKDAVNDEGNPVYQGIDKSKLVPLLTAALQEALAKIETLEQRLSDAGIA